MFDDKLKMSRRGFFGLTAITMVAASGCAATNLDKRILARHETGVLRIGIASSPSNINPLDSGSENTRWIAEPVMESLYAYNDQHESVPLLAAGEPVISADQLTWTIPLRKDITFQNGDPFTADDVVASLARVNDLGAGSEWITFFLGYIQDYVAVDDYTVRIGLAQPYGLMRSHLTNLPISHKDYAGRKDAMMGTGPFKLVSFVAGQSFIMKRYDGYHGGRPELEGIEYTVFADGATRLLSIKHGNVDFVPAIPYAHLDSARKDPNIRLNEVNAPFDVLSYVGINKEPFSDFNFRMAVAIACDREGVRKKVFGGAAVAGQGVIGPAQMGWDPDFEFFSAVPDLELARSFMAKAKTKKLAFTMSIGTNNTTRDMAQVLAAGWKKIGVDVKIEQLSGPAFSNKMLDRSYDMLMELFQSGFTSGPSNIITLAPADPANVLSCGYQNPQITEWTKQVWQTDDDDLRAEILTKMNRVLTEDAVIFPPVYPKLVAGRRKEVSPLNTKQMEISRIQPQGLHLKTEGA